MKPFILAAAACALLLAAAPGAQAELVEMKGPPPPDNIHTMPELPIKLFVQAMNAGDWDRAANVVSPSAIIIDDLLPFRWRSFAAWRRSVTQYRATFHVTDYHMALMSFLVSGGTYKADYSVQPAILSYKENGEPRTEKGFFTFTTAKIAGRWTITGWSWTNVERSDFWAHVAPEQPLY
jgi:hypothetical protein